jgi:hypothetical protein
MKLIVRIEPNWFYGPHEVVVDLDPEDIEGYTPDEIENNMAEIAQDVFNNAVSYGYELVND